MMDLSQQTDIANALFTGPMALCDAGDDEFDEELTEGYRGMADVEDLLWDDEADQGGAHYFVHDMA